MQSPTEQAERCSIAWKEAVQASKATSQTLLNNAWEAAEHETLMGATWKTVTEANKTSKTLGKLATIAAIGAGVAGTAWLGLKAWEYLTTTTYRDAWSEERDMTEEEVETFYNTIIEVASDQQKTELKELREGSTREGSLADCLKAEHRDEFLDHLKVTSDQREHLFPTNTEIEAEGGYESDASDSYSIPMFGSFGELFDY